MYRRDREERHMKKEQGGITIKLMPDQSEVIPYNTKNAPIYMRSGLLSMYAGMRSLCHWHKDFEMIRVWSGHFFYWVNEDVIRLDAGDLLFVNSGVMHYGYSDHGEDCDFTCMILHPTLLPAHGFLKKTYVEPFMKNQAAPYIHLKHGMRETEQLLGDMDRMIRVCQEGPDGMELEIAGLFCLILGQILKLQPEDAKSDPGMTETKALKDMISYIYDHYQETITLEQIAKAGNMCRSRCCQLFKHHLGTSPMDFVNQYRLEMSANLLENSDYSITEIMAVCGFNHPSYFSKMFVRVYGVTPSGYRKKVRGNAEISK